jgi:hypothetical protein
MGELGGLIFDGLMDDDLASVAARTSDMRQRFADLHFVEI